MRMCVLAFVLVRADRTQAVINRGSEEVIMDYLIGPLPLSPATTIRPLTEIYHNPMPLNARSNFNWTRIRNDIGHLTEPIDEVLRDLFNGSVKDGSLSAAGHAPSSYDGTWRRMWLQLRRTRPGSFLQGLDFHIRVSETEFPSLHRPNNS